MPQPRYYPKVSRPPALRQREIEFLDWLDWFILTASARATTELTRYRVMMITAVVAGAAAAGSVAARLPVVITATLGAVAAACVGIQAILRD